MRRKSSRRYHRGLTLIEIVATLGVLATIAVAAASLLTAVTQIGQHNARAKQVRVTILRLADQFQRDVAATVSLTPAENEQGITLVQNQQVIRYRWNPDVRSIIRSVSLASPASNASATTEAATGETSVVDRFVLSAECDPRFVVDGDRVTVTLKPGTPAWILEATQ